ncbi:Pollen Ole e 1 allergen/extensin [Macleaya cordata]|uniref:Pollen Ole e 1 allergen/extensin n=1 Tax=Macleaya cordata TaxID=56857 RepID=A0A200QK26_MACCD|nr:Pollen Ole e 1 allergen/extensin [Macleaya cordata]
MAKFSQAVLLLLAALCIFTVASAADFKVQGKVYCDTCLVGFETRVTEYIKGANVTLECRDREGGHLTYTVDGVTDENGVYTISADGEHEEEVCEVVLKESPRSDCNKKFLGRTCGRVAITKNNGILSPVRFVNSLGFLINAPITGCAQVITELELTPEDIMI